MNGWTCPSCGVNYAPSVTECRCSVVDVEREKDAERIRQIVEEWKKNPPPVVPTPPVYGPPWVDPMEYWRQPPWQRGSWYGDVVRPTLTVDKGESAEKATAAVFYFDRDGSYRRIDIDFPQMSSVDTSNIDYLQMSELGGRQ